VGGGRAKRRIIPKSSITEYYYRTEYLQLFFERVNETVTNCFTEFPSIVPAFSTDTFTAIKCEICKFHICHKIPAPVKLPSFQIIALVLQNKCSPCEEGTSTAQCELRRDESPVHSPRGSHGLAARVPHWKLANLQQLKLKHNDAHWTHHWAQYSIRTLIDFNWKIENSSFRLIYS
jgi:hypothetical protein